jgi:hypothetical protein
VLNDEHHFYGLWSRAQNLPSLANLTPGLIEAWARVKGLQVVSVEERSVGAFSSVPCIVLTTPGRQACFPKVPSKGELAWCQRRQHADEKAGLWRKMDWFAPLWLPRGKLSPLLRDVAHASPEEAVKCFDYHTSTLYTLAFEAVCIAQILPEARSLREFAPLAREAYLAFYSGYRASSIAALIPLIEGGLARIVPDSGLKLADKIGRVVSPAMSHAAELHFDRMWAPPEYLTVEYLFGEDERVFFLETFRLWLERTFFSRTGEYAGASWLNRHIFAHAASSSWQQMANFSRLVVALATLGVVESWHDRSSRVSLLFPEMNKDSVLLWTQAKFQAKSQFFLKLIQEKLYHRHGSLVPELPTDDGVLLRKAILLKDCIDDLVRPLRNAGWDVEVGEPDERALFVRVVATGENGRRLRVALLYSCATGNELYKKLALDSDVVLYRGAPYHQSQYAYGLTIPVGPVAGWLPPRGSDAPKPLRQLWTVAEARVRGWFSRV